MRHFHAAIPALIALAAVSPASAGSKPFKATSDYKKDSEPKGYLNLKFDTYATMYENPKGTDCDWVFKADNFNLEDIRKSGVTYYAGGLSTGTGNPYLDLAMMGAFYGNGLASTFENTLGGMGIQMTRPNAPKSGDDTLKADQAKLVSLKAKLDSDLTGMDLEMEKATFDDEKGKLGVAEAVKAAQARAAARNAKIQAQITELEAKLAASKPASAKPEDQKGYVLVLYLMDAGMAGGGFSPVPTNSTTAEFCLLLDGKPVLAGRNTSVSMYFGNSTAKCAQKLASAFAIKP